MDGREETFAINHGLGMMQWCTQKILLGDWEAISR
jgi:hypothetical protein